MNKTKEELQTEILELQAQLVEMGQQLAARDAALAGSGEDGWLITTRNPAYSGVTAGVRFVNGRAFIGKSQKDAEFKVKILASDFHYKVQAMTAADFRALAEEAPAPPADESRSFIKQVSQPAVVGGA